jgi:hypothetical protein
MLGTCTHDARKVLMMLVKVLIVVHTLYIYVHTGTYL